MKRILMINEIIKHHINLFFDIFNVLYHYAKNDETT